MAIEYTLRFAHPDSASVAEALRPLPFLREPVPQSEEFEFSSARSTEVMPEASMRVKSYGLYFCDHGGVGREMLGIVVARLVSRFGSITIEEL
jgi:hypothetical protein